MNGQRGDVVLAWYPFASGQGSKRRPRVVVQNDADNTKLNNVVVAQITSNLTRLGDKSHCLIQLATAEGQLAGVLHDCLVSCNNLATIEQALIARTIGSLSPSLGQKLDVCLKAALGLP